MLTTHYVYIRLLVRNVLGASFLPTSVRKYNPSNSFRVRFFNSGHSGLALRDRGEMIEQTEPEVGDVNMSVCSFGNTNN